MSWKTIRYISFWTVMFLALLLFAFVPNVLVEAQKNTAADVAVPTLDELDQLRMSGMVKDLVIAQKNLQLLRAQLVESSRNIARISGSITEAIGGLRTKYEAPGDKFDFDINTLRFIPVEKAEKDDNE